MTTLAVDDGGCVDLVVNPLGVGLLASELELTWVGSLVAINPSFFTYRSPWWDRASVGTYPGNHTRYRSGWSNLESTITMFG